MTPVAQSRIVVRPLVPSDLPALASHLARHSMESGRDGDVIFSPYEEPRVVPFETFQAGRTAAWSKPATEIGWERAWGIVEDGQIFGEIRLVPSHPLVSALHRARLMMGIERSHRRLGFGSALISAALDWARQEPSLDWVELGVFEHNAPARALYTKFGFQEVGRTEDLFRVHGVRLTDISMSLRVR